LELIELYNYTVEDQIRQHENEVDLIAWQTALLMNATGNYKKHITPEMLVGKEKEKESSSSRLDADKDRDTVMAELMDKFK
jgi:hypothetical protein